ncbi:O-antigen ligase [Streptomyces sp. DH37]|uniref:O-antigen ligase family protein n=1 Tax=Streptomyces sp. DH37 TaxID=3040122 RepID=UPI0024416DDE|nr:O-antigen ligase family protein [Streptomyces sp. DH37]MDG9701066.1 O-antigen ligase family protein [Streptomyces sp. DH37]
MPDVAGAAVLGCCAGWALVCAMGRDARPEGVLLAVLAVAAGYACGRIGGSVLPAAAPAAAALAGLASFVLFPGGFPGVLTGTLPGGFPGGFPSGFPGVPPPDPSAAAPGGRAGADAALAALTAGAACCAAWAAGDGRTRRLLHALALVVAAVALAAGSPAGCAAALGVLLCSLAAGRVRRRLPALAALAVAAAAVAGAVWAVAGDALPPELERPLQGPLTAQRVALWEEALALAVEQPVRGAGPDRFGGPDRAAARAAVPDGKPHSAPLQLAAEQGLPGVALLGAVFGWLLLALYRSPRPTPVVLAAGAALTALAALASVSNALSFNQVTAGAGLLAGLATAREGGDVP